MMSSVSLIMPLYNEAADIADVLRSLSLQTCAHAAMYAIIVDGGSTDGSREIVERWLAGGSIAGVLVSNPHRTIPSSMNVGIKFARPDDIIVRLDAHTTYAPDYVQNIVEAFAREPATVGCVGGPQQPRRETRFDLALVTALYTNPIGLGGADFRRLTSPAPARGVYLGAWRPGVLTAAGGFDEHWIANEDAELSARVRGLGYQILLIPIRSEYRVKRGPLTAVRQWGRYGYWRAQTLRRHPDEFRLRHLAPPLALIVCLILMMTPLRLVAAALYAIYVAAICLKREAREPVLVTLAAAVFFPACQMSWAGGLLRGFIAPDGKTKMKAPSMKRVPSTGPASASGRQN
jgi:succinoglycan biosynthesis protein ExoA